MNEQAKWLRTIIEWGDFKPDRHRDRKAMLDAADELDRLDAIVATIPDKTVDGVPVVRVAEKVPELWHPAEFGTPNRVTQGEWEFAQVKNWDIIGSAYSTCELALAARTNESDIQKEVQNQSESK